jgi:hypothetical protein
METPIKSSTNIDWYKLKTASEPMELAVEEVDIGPIEAFEFDNTGHLEPLDEIIGQDRAMAAIEVGLGISQEGYNIFVAGLTGTGKMGTIRNSLQRRLDGSKVPDDWVYLHNFDNPDEPWAVKLPAGKAKPLQKDMNRFVERLKEALPKAFHQQDFGREKEHLSEKYQDRIEQQAEKIRSQAKEHGFQAVFSEAGGVGFVPLIEGKPAEKKNRLKSFRKKKNKGLQQPKKSSQRK